MDRGVDLAFTRFHDHDPAVMWDFFRQHQTSELAEECIANFEVKDGI
jgi:hypothetical protein